MIIVKNIFFIPETQNTEHSNEGHKEAIQIRTHPILFIMFL